MWHQQPDCEHLEDRIRVLDFSPSQPPTPRKVPGSCSTNLYFTNTFTWLRRVRVSIFWMCTPCQMLYKHYISSTAEMRSCCSCVNTVTSSSWFAGDILDFNTRSPVSRAHPEGRSPCTLGMRLPGLREIGYLHQLVLEIRIQVCLGYGIRVLRGTAGALEKREVGLFKASW